jgi:hypothetical protein
MNGCKRFMAGWPGRPGHRHGGGRLRGPARRAALAGSSAVVLLGGLAAGGVTAGSALAAEVPARAAAGSAAAGPASGTVLLINGDRIAMTRTPSGLRVAMVRAPAGGGLNAAQFRLELRGKAYDIPADALPYLNRGLSPGLFELSSLQRLESGGRLPVQVSYDGRAHALPGVTITRSGRGSMHGYLTAASATVFGAALARQMRADHARGSYGTDGIFAGGVSIGLPGQPVVPQAGPNFPMHTLTMTGTDFAGQPDTGDEVFAFNVDNPLAFGDRFESVSAFDHGSAKFSVPAGHYMAVGVFFDTPAFRLVTLPQFTVAGNATAAVDERTATSHVQMLTPRPAVTQGLILTVRRTAANGDVIAFSADTVPFNPPLWTNQTTRPVTVGTLRTITTGYLTSPPGAGSPYQYDLAFAGPNGVIGPQRHVVKKAGLATVHASYFQDGASTGGWAATRFFAFELSRITFLFADVFPFQVPRSLTEYFSAGPSLFWLNRYWQSGANFDGGQADATRTFVPGQVTAENWNAYPLHPAPSVSVLGSADPIATVPSASRAGDTLWLDTIPFGDNTPGHTGDGFFRDPFGSSGTFTGSYELDQNGKPIASGNAVQAAGGLADLLLHARLSRAPATIRFVLSATRTGSIYRLSTASRTVWTWRSARHPGVTVPAGWICPDGTFSCSVEPMMTLLYQVRGLAVNGSAPAGRQLIQVSAGHLQLARAARVTGATAQVSVDDGRTWRPATVTPAGGGRFHVAFTAPPGAFVTLRVHAADAAGGQITETITRGYRTGPGTAGTATAGTATTGTALAASGPAAAPPPGPGPRRVRAACGPVPATRARCLALFAPQDAVNAAIALGVRGPASQPRGLSPQDIESAYKLPVSRNSHQTVALVEAFNTPALDANLAVYRSHYGLGPCRESTGCLRVVNQNGHASPLPASGVPFGWDVETTLDASMVSAACPRCKILVVEANDDNLASLAAAENTAARLGAQVISNSYGARETGFSQPFASAYDHRGHAIVVSSGDFGFTAASFPANLATVTAAGGTELARARNARGWAERVWNEPPSLVTSGGASGSGCSAYVPKPAWQHDPHCGMRTVADVAAVAWNVPIYEKIQGGWLTVGGTSVSAPLIAGVYGLAGNAATIAPGHEYTRARSLFDITTGNNDWFNGAGGASCGFDYLCTGRKGYDGPTGLGTPDGTGAF